MSGSIDLDIEGEPSSIEACAEWLRRTLRDAMSEHADGVYDGRADAERAWEGEAGDAFRGRLSTLASAGDDVSGWAQTQGQSLDTLAADLNRCQEDATTACDTAAAAGLSVSGTVITDPGAGPTRPVTPSPDAPDSVILSHNQAVDAYDAHQDLIEAWNAANVEAERIFDAWDAAVAAAAERWQTNAGNLATLAHGFLGAGGAGLSAGAAASRFHGRAALHASNVTSLQNHVNALTNPDGTTRGPNTRLNDLLNEIDAERVAAEQARVGAQGAGPSARVSNLLRRLGYVATGYAIYDDYVNGGESIEQAVVSNGAGLLAGAAAGAGAGALIGSVVPVAGTAVGAAAGFIIGAGVGIFTSGMIDSIWENGVDSLEDLGGAAWGGVTEVGDTIVDAGGLVADGVSAGWNALFG